MTHQWNSVGKDYISISLQWTEPALIDRSVQIETYEKFLSTRSTRGVNV